MRPEEPVTNSLGISKSGKQTNQNKKWKSISAFPISAFSQRHFVPVNSQGLFRLARNLHTGDRASSRLRFASTRQGAEG
jgi:hypothetical protein